MPNLRSELRKMPLKARVFGILEASGDRASKVFNISMMTLIALNIGAFIIETEKSIAVGTQELFANFEVFCILVFTIEYILRLWSCTVDEKYRHPVWGRIKFAFTFLAIVDLVAILPFYLPIILPNLVVLRVLRFFRIVRLFKMGRYSESLRTLGRVLESKKEDLIVTLFIVAVLLILSSTLAYFAEHEAQPKVFSSIPIAMWWSVVTLTSVGYGDIYPITPIGKFLGGIISLLGLGIVALPTGLIASGFTEEITQKRIKRELVCPHCGQPIDAEDLEHH